ncbi:MAG: hypothetical protein IH969_06615 [Candidatus Krumholzibacteriota bacterium]|nr:hypothetical protein [Candidatus Krumholzibacteriota bacterium]
MRFTGISNLLPGMSKEDRFKIFKSMAAMMLGKFPSAETVTVHMDLWGVDKKDGPADYPSMKEFRDGVRPKWLPVGEAFPFSRKDLESEQTNPNQELAAK